MTQQAYSLMFEIQYNVLINKQLVNKISNE